MNYEIMVSYKTLHQLLCITPQNKPFTMDRKTITIHRPRCLLSNHLLSNAQTANIYHASMPYLKDPGVCWSPLECELPLAQIHISMLEL